MTHLQKALLFSVGSIVFAEKAGELAEVNPFGWWEFVQSIFFLLFWAALSVWMFQSLWKWLRQ